MHRPPLARETGLDCGEDSSLLVFVGGCGAGGFA